MNSTMTTTASQVRVSAINPVLAMSLPPQTLSEWLQALTRFHCKCETLVARLRLDVDVIRLFAALLAVPHRPIGFLEMARIERAVEERLREAVVAESAAQRCEQCWLLRQAQRQFLIFRGRAGDEFRQADGLQQARGNAARESVAEQGQERQPGPERIARRGVRIAIEGVEEEIGEAVTREMLRRCDSRREDEALGCHAARLRMATQIRPRRGGVLEQPQHAAL